MNEVIKVIEDIVRSQYDEVDFDDAFNKAIEILNIFLNEEDLKTLKTNVKRNMMFGENGKKFIFANAKISLRERFSVKNNKRLSQNKITLYTTPNSMYTSKKIIRGDVFGTVAKEEYLECSKVLNFDESKKNHFASQKHLFSRNCTKEGYGVWFLSNSNLSEKNNEGWKNTILDFNRVIKEECKKENREDMPELYEKRLVFAAQKHGTYVFMGTFECNKIEGNNAEYRLVSDVYPD